MIDFKVKSNEEELKIASENLPDEFYIGIETKYKDSLHSVSHLWLFPYSENVLCSEKDFSTYFSYANYCDVLYRTPNFPKEETIFMKLYNIPLKYNYIDIYAIGYGDCKLSIEIEFCTKKMKYLFGYKNTFYYNNLLNGADFNVLIGTLGRVTNGWKFYPMFKETRKNKNEIIKKYI